MVESFSRILGNCLCKQVSVEIAKKPETFSVCHCQACRKWTGGVSMNFNGGQHLRFSREELVGRYSSSEWAERGFCKNCGTNLFYRLKKTDHYFLSINLFNDQFSPKFDLQEFIDEKPECYAFANNTKMMTKAEAYSKLDEYLKR